MKRYQKPQEQLKIIITPTKKKINCLDVTHDLKYIGISTDNFVLIWNIFANTEHLKIDTKYCGKQFCKFSGNSNSLVYRSDFFQVSLINIEQPESSKNTISIIGYELSINSNNFLLTQYNCFKIIELNSLKNIIIPQEIEANYFVNLMKDNNQYFCCINHKNDINDVAFVKIWHIHRGTFYRSFKIINYSWQKAKMILNKTFLIIFYHNSFHKKPYLLLYNMFNNKLISKFYIGTSTNIYISQMNFSDDDQYIYFVTKQGLVQIDLSRRSMFIQNLDKDTQFTISSSGKYLVGLKKKKIIIQTLK